MNTRNKKSAESPHDDQLPLLKKLGPGLITGAADDDPSGIAAYCQRYGTGRQPGPQHSSALQTTARAGSAVELRMKPVRQSASGARNRVIRWSPAVNCAD
jgi:hypothetical protein